MDFGSRSRATRQSEACSRFTATRVTLETCLTLARVSLVTRLASTVLVLALCACASYVSRSGQIRAALIADDYEQALKVVEEIDHSNSKLLYLYEKGMVLHCQGDWAGSSAAFTESELVLEDLYTKSVTREVASLAISETISQYRGDAFEAAYIHYYQILNYLARNDVEGAMVECRRVNRKLQMLNDGGETYFVNDPFLQYLTGIVYEMGGDREAAGVSYRVASGLYESGAYQPVTPVPEAFFCDAAANAMARADRAEADLYASRARCAAGADTGRVSLFFECGQIIRKRENSIVLPIFANDRWTDNEKFARELSTRHGVNYGSPVKVKYWLKVALPALEPAPPLCSNVRVRARSLDQGHLAETRAAVVSNLDALAVQAFREKEATMFGRAIVRALVKYLAQQEADKSDEGLGALVNLFNVVTETADTRSWSSLPGAIFLARLDLPAGSYRIEVDFLGTGGSHAGSVVFDNVAVSAGKHVVRNARAY